MNESQLLYGIKSVKKESMLIEVGALSFTLEGSGIRHVRLGDKEMVRAIAFLARDHDWGTLEPELKILKQSVRNDRAVIEISANYCSREATLESSLKIEANSAFLKFSSNVKAIGDFETNRSGFTVLHPASAAGCLLTVEHSNGEIDISQFPVLIDPWQPFMEIRSLTHHQNGLSVSCFFEGDVFEMEDQRQWGDASFKTYNRPIALAWPYTINDGEGFAQSVTISWQQSVISNIMPSGEVLPLKSKNKKPTFPNTAILVTAEHAKVLIEKPDDLLKASPQRLLCHLDNTIGDMSEQIENFAKLQKNLKQPIYDLELVCGFEKYPYEELLVIDKLMKEFGFKPNSIMVCPSADRISTPPGSIWPDCPSLIDVHTASRDIFGDVILGGGMVSFFPELNRKRPPVEILDFVSHSLCPIVHAADDISVMETLEAINHISRTARSFIGDAEYRIGPSTIGMRQNPYGSRTKPNPEKSRVCMAADDPRHGAKFGAAYTVGLAVALAESGIAVWTPSEMFGVRGLNGPIVEAIKALSLLSGEPVHNTHIKNGIANMEVGKVEIQTNLTAEKNAGLRPYEWTVGTFN